LENTVKIFSASIEFFSSVQSVSLPSKTDKITPVHVLVLHLSNFCTYFYFKLCRFYDWGRKNIACRRAQGTLAWPLGLKAIIPLEAK